jgi:hypothetical protein
VKAPPAEGAEYTVRHFDLTQWTDYVRGLSSDTQQARMKEHLAGCPQCGEFVRMLQKLVAVVNKPLSRDVPDYVVHNAISIAALGRPEKVTFAAVVAKLIYDSFREPLPAGVRSQQTVSRQALYEAGEFSVDLRLEHERISNEIPAGKASAAAVADSFRRKVDRNPARRPKRRFTRG